MPPAEEVHTFGSFQGGPSADARGSRCVELGGFAIKAECASWYFRVYTLVGVFLTWGGLQRVVRGMQRVVGGMQRVVGGVQGVVRGCRGLWGGCRGLWGGCRGL